jgi:cell division protein FtsL
MDNMAYLQQIATGGNNHVAPKKQKADNPLAKIFNIWTILGIVAFVLILIITVVLVSVFNKVDTIDQDIMKKSYFVGTQLNEEILDEYTSEVKNSDHGNQLVEKYGVEDIDFDPEEVELVREDANKISELSETLLDAKLSGILDRVFLREMTLWTAYIISYESEIMARSEDPEVDAVAQKALENLNNIYVRFHDFTSPTL